MSRKNLNLKIYRVSEEIPLPKFATKSSACFDVAYYPNGKTHFTVYNTQNKKIERPFSNDGRLMISPGDRALVPTGLIFDIPEGFSVRFHARSGLALKEGMMMANAEAVIDSDYVQESFVMVYNASFNTLTISPGDRIAQGELVEKIEYSIEATKNAPIIKTDRIGGFGSTGIKERTIYSIDVGDMSPEKAEMIVKETMEKVTV